MAILTYIALFAPLLGFLILMFSSAKISRLQAGIIACSAIFISFVCFSTLLYLYNEPQTYVLAQWIPLESIRADFSFHIDPLSLVMTLIVSGVGFLIHVYSYGYMDHDEGYARYFAFLNFFVFCMLLLVLANHLLLLFVGWEGVGLASYLLIGFWFQKPSAAEAATKAFVVNRIGDVGFLLALLLTFSLFNTGNIEEISQRAGLEFSKGSTIITILTLLYFFAATGKSAQIPLHVWLPDAMEGPTPVSALIHAATMVTAGVYLVVRMHVLFALAPFTLAVIGVIGAITCLFAAIWAIGQNDIKRVLAYSTISQLGLMFVACGIEAYYAAIFHLTTHAFMKALLFLAAGNVIHMLHGLTDMEKMGGLWKIFRHTHWLFLIGALAMSGVPPLAAFFSKDLILEQELETGHTILFHIALAASILTAFYLTRAYALTFLGNSRDAEAVKDAHEAPPVMLGPVTVLAFLTILGGFLGFAFGRMPILEYFLLKIDISLPFLEAPGEYIYSLDTLLALIGAAIGIGVGLLLYVKKEKAPKTDYPFVQKGFYIDYLYEQIFVKPTAALSKALAFFAEPQFFDRIITSAKQFTQSTANWFYTMQSGQIRSYVAWMAMGTFFIILYLII